MILGESVAFQAAGGALAFAFGAAFAALLFFAAFLEKKFKFSAASSALLRFFLGAVVLAAALTAELFLAGGTFAPYRVLSLLAGALAAYGARRIVREFKARKSEK